ncbi:hypothetical protein [Candidatus Carsonella ruddii]|uniref:Uncharacterized protein n=1 Tax=Carsonella ruddii TaxID=114186 RepID=A0A1U9RS06_CARRU|nr:hypothetical protein [Candidatus Carsonella ruddii]AQU89559.1 hypothetical protein BW244_0141 [Candidatus Carsonella ruddii]
MKKKFVFLIYNKINCVSNFYNYLTQINLKIELFKIKSINKNHLKIIFINDSYFKINQFLKSLSKCLNLNKIYIFKNIKKIIYKNIFNKIKIKFYKNFIFLNFINKYLFFYNSKKKNYVLSILNNFLNYKNIL